MPKQSVSIWEDCIIYSQMLEGLYHGQRGAWKDTLLKPVWVQKPNILIHVENISVTKAFNILTHIDYLLQILILSIVEDRIVHDDTINRIILVCAYDVLLQYFPINFL